jgi:DNA invertase Pin-like site-specific DNA recombinase
MTEDQVNAVAYIRVSRACQADGGSLEYQESKIRFYCSINHINLVDIITDVASGGSLDRKGIQEVIKLIEHRDHLPIKINAVVVHKADRLTRSFSDYNRLRELMFNPITNVSLHLAEGSGLMPPGCRDIISRIKQSEIELEKIRQRTKDGLSIRRAKGLSFGRPKFGYRYVGGKLVKDDLYYPILEEVVSRRALGESICSITEDLLLRGISTRKGIPIHRSTIYRWLKGVKDTTTIDEIKNKESRGKKSATIGIQEELF